MAKGKPQTTADPTESPPTSTTTSADPNIPADLIATSNSFGRSCYILGDQRGNKMRILSLIARHRLSVKSISSLLGLSESSTSQHLSRLQAHGVISGQREGHQTIYQINPNFLSQFTSTFNEVLPNQGE